MPTSEPSRTPGLYTRMVYRLFLDFSKAYDRMEWPWLRAVMKHVGAGPNMLTWMDPFYPHVSENALHRHLILPNGWSRPIRMLRGTLHGWPWSPFLFNLSVKPWLRPMATYPRREGIRLSKEVSTKFIRLRMTPSSDWTTKRIWAWHWNV